MKAGAQDIFFLPAKYRVRNVAFCFLNSEFFYTPKIKLIEVKLSESKTKERVRNYP